MRTLLRPGRAARAVACLLLSAPMTSFALAQSQPRDGRAINDTTLEIAPNGDVTEKVKYRVTQSDWNRLNKSGLGANYFKRHLGSYRADWIEAPGSYVFERTEGSSLGINLTITELGGARNLGDGDWEFEVAPTASYFNTTTENGRPVCTFRHAGNILPAAGCISAATLASGLGSYEGKLLVHLPPAATDVQWDEGQRVIRYRIAPATGTGAGRIRGTLEARECVLPTAYKVYGIGTSIPGFSDQWVARTTFVNQSSNVVKNVEVKYRTSSLVKDAMGVQRFGEIAPGQTAVSVFYPIFDRDIVSNERGSMSNVVVEWTYTDAEGKQQRGSESKPIRIAGHREFQFSDIKAGHQHDMIVDIYSNAPLLAAWVTENDAPVLDVSNSAIAFMRRTRPNPGDMDILEWLYNTMLVFDLVYKKPSTRTETSRLDFDEKGVQTVYLPRDVIEGNAGTCIDLAILYAAMAKTQGLKPYLMLVPGHCFPVIGVKDVGLVAVEATMIQGGWQGPHGSWAEALQAGQQEYAKWKNSPDALLLDLETLWSSGVHGPELPPYPTGGLVARKKDRESLWNRLMGIQNSPVRVDGDSQPALASPDSLPSNLEGTWRGVNTVNGRDYTLDVEITRAGRTFRLKLEASIDNAQVTEQYEGNGGSGPLTMNLVTRTMTDRATKEVREDRTTRAQLIVRQESVASLQLERTRRDRVEKSQTYRLNRQQ